MLCKFGVGAVALAALALFIFMHLPWPWGTGTLPGGLVGLGEENRIENTEAWQADLAVGAFSIGICGIVFLVAGLLILGLSKKR